MSTGNTAPSNNSVDIGAIISLIAAFVPLVTDEMDLWNTAKNHMAQNDELTPELEKALDDKIAAIGTKPEDQQQPL